MLFAHGPVGFLSVTPLKKFWKKLKKRERYFLMALGGVAAMSPDIDLFYFYLVSAEHSHRQYVTHTPIFWVALGLLIYLLGKLLKKRMVGWSGVVVGVGGLSHIVMDSITGRAAWLYPFTRELFGISSVTWLPEWFISNLLFVNFLLEGIVFVGFFLTLNKMFVKKKRMQKVLIGLTAFAGFIGVTGLVYVNQHVAHINPNAYHNDTDDDGLANLEDVDIDGDGLHNSYDKDADGDGIDNDEQLVEFAVSLRGVWRAPFGDRGFEQTRRFGFVNNQILGNYTFDSAGQLLGPEMEQDYNNNPDGYIKTPDDHDFRRQNENLLAFLDHTDRLLGPKTTPKAGDVVFIQKGEKLYVAIGVYTKPAGLLYADPDIPSDIYSWSSIQRVGEVVSVGRFH